LTTFLRDPVDRVVSNYYFLRTKSPVSEDSETALRAARSLSLKDFLLCEDPNVRMVSENFQTKALAFDIRPDHLEPSMSNALLKNASRNLATFDFIGITEYFGDSVRVLSEMLGVELSVKKLNVNPERPGSPATAEELDIARSLNRLDLELYDKARSSFERRYLGGRAVARTEALLNYKGRAPLTNTGGGDLSTTATGALDRVRPLAESHRRHERR
jgi:hypothetical protein